MRQGPYRLLSALAMTLVLTLLAAPAFAQGAAGISTTLTGSVVDSTGGVVPGVDVQAKHNATATIYQAVTDSTGRFTIPAIGPGTYTVTIALMGFKTVVLPDVTVIAGTPASIKPVTLEVGALEESVTVTGATELVQTQTAEVTTTLTTTQISHTPLATRNTLDFVSMLPGVSTTSTARNSTIMGLPGSAVNITIDGINTQDNALKGDAGNTFFSMINPRLDAVEEVTVSTANPGAESSGQGSVQVRFQTRSGTNKFAGSAYEYMRRTGWNTNYWFNKNQNDPALPNDATRIDTFGGRLGGPIMRDKAFFFFNYEEFRQPLSMSRSRTVLTPESLAGRFVYAANPAGIDLYGLAKANGQVADPDPTVMQLLNDINATLGKGSIKAGTNSVTNAFSFQNSSVGRRIYPTTRVDVNVTSKHRAGVSFYLQRYISNPDILNSRDPAFPGYPMQGNQTSWRPAVMGNWRWIVSPNIVNEVRSGYTGWTGTHFSDNVTAADFPGGVRFTTLAGLVSTPYCCGNYEIRSSPVLNFEDTLNWLKGKHSLSMGASFTRVAYNDYYKYYVPGIQIGFNNTYDPARTMFNKTNFPGATDSDLSNARSLYALLTGRVSSITNTAYLNPGTGQYEYMGPWQYWVKQGEIGSFVSDSWKVKPNLTINGGIRYQLQLPFVSANHYFTELVDYQMLYGISGTDANGNPNYFAPGSNAGSSAVQFKELTPGSLPFKTDKNNWAPSVGLAYRPSVKANSWLAKILSQDPVVRGGYSRAYTRESMNRVSGIYSYNPGGFIDVSRNTTLGNLVYPGESWPILLRDKNRLGAPTFPETPAYPLTPAFTNSINAFYPNTQTPWVHSFNISFQRALTKDTAVDLRYVGTRARGGWVSGGRNINERIYMENGFYEEFKHAQANYLINEATYGWGTKQGDSFKYNNLPGQYPLPIFQAFYSGLPSAQAGDVSKYTSSNYSNTTYLAALVPTNVDITDLAGPMFTDKTMRENGLAAGLPANFFYMNPAISGGVYVTGRPEDSQKTNFDALQIELRRRMSKGLLIQGSYQYIARATATQNLSLRVAQDWYEQSSPKHSVKVNWVYELPFGQGKRFGGNVSRGWNRLVGGWSFDGIARIQTGARLDFGNVRLVNMTDADLQKMYKVRIVADDVNPKIKRVYMLPRDVIENTIKAFNTSYSSPTGYSTSAGAPTGQYFAPINSDGCIQIYTGSCGAPIHHYVTGPKMVRFDMSLAKRVDLTSRVFGEFRLEALNVFDNVNFYGVTAVDGSTVTSFQVTSAYRDSSNTQDPGGRLLQLSFRVSF